jgi:hypothetical protein
MIWFYAVAGVVYSALGLVAIQSLWKHVCDLSERVERLEKRYLESERYREEVREAIASFESHYGPLDAVEASDAEPLSEATLKRLRKAFSEENDA